MSTLLLNTLTGKTSAGSIVVTGEGGSNTTNLQQGLTKFWVKWNGTGTAAESDSFNSSGLTDNNTGDTTFGFTTNMGNANYSLTTSNSSAEANNSQTGMVTPTTSSIRMDTRSGANDANLDTSKNSAQINGDLA